MTCALEHHIYASCALEHHIFIRAARSNTIFLGDLRAEAPYFWPIYAFKHYISAFSCALRHHISVDTNSTCALKHHILAPVARWSIIFWPDLRVQTPYVSLPVDAFQPAVGFLHFVYEIYIGLQRINNV
jgi:hypothetical protein